MTSGDTSGGHKPTRNSPPPTASRPQEATRSAASRAISQPATGATIAIVAEPIASTIPASHSGIMLNRSKK